MTRQGKLHLPDYLPYLLNRVGAAMVARFTQDALAQHGLSIATWRVLVALSDLGPQRLVDLSDLTSIDASTLSRLVTRLIRMGLVTRARSRLSNREVTIGLTPKAGTLIGRLIPVARQLERDAIAGLRPAELAAAKRALRRMYQNIGPGAVTDRSAPTRKRARKTRR